MHRKLVTKKFLCATIKVKVATLRDRPWVYDDYRVCDFLSISKDDDYFFHNYNFNALTTVAALGFGDIPPHAFYNAYNFIEEEGFVAFNIKEEFFLAGEQSPFSSLIQSMIRKEILQIEIYKRYRHRINIAGEPIFYIAIVARKKSNIPEDLLESI